MDPRSPLGKFQRQRLTELQRLGVMRKVNRSSSPTCAGRGWRRGLALGGLELGGARALPSLTPDAALLSFGGIAGGVRGLPSPLTSAETLSTRPARVEVRGPLSRPSAGQPRSRDVADGSGPGGSRPTSRCARCGVIEDDEHPLVAVVTGVEGWALLCLRCLDASRP